MKRTAAFHAILGAVAVAAAIVAPLPAATPPNFDVITRGPVEFAFEPVPCGGFRVTGVAVATGTHVGEEGTFAANECSRPDGAVNHIDGRATLTTTGGDQIFIHYYGDAPPFNVITGELAEDIAFSIIGGSGHFADASGGGRLTTEAHFYASPIVTARLVGSIEIHSH